MTPDLYVDSNASGGTETGLSWANAHLSLDDAINDATNPIAEGDIVFVAHNHNVNYGSGKALTFPDNVTLVSVNSGTDAYEAGAIEGCLTSGADFIITHGDGDWINFIGIKFDSDDTFQFGKHGSRCYFEGCTFKRANISNTGAAIVPYGTSSDGAYINLKDCAIDMPSDTGHPVIESKRACVYDIDNLTNANANTQDSFCNTGGLGQTISVRNTDLSALVKSTGNLIDTVTAGDDIIIANFTRCKMPASYNLTDVSTNSNILINLSSCDNGDGYHYFHMLSNNGEVLENTTVVRTGGATYDGTNQFSVEYQANSNVNAFTNPLRYKLGDYQLDLTAGATLTYHFMQQNTVAPTGLTDHECWIEVVHPGTDNALGVTVDSRGNAAITDTPDTLTESNETWASTTGDTTKQQVSVILPTVAGMTKAPVTAYFCVAKDIVTAGDELFVCPKPEITI